MLIVLHISVLITDTIMQKVIHDRMAFITGVSAGELASQKDELIAEVQVYINDANARYDEETEHGTNVTRQNSWEANIARVKGDVNGIISDLP